MPKILSSQSELDVESILEWEKFGTDLVGAIDDGFLDRMLKDLTTACVKRARIIGAVKDAPVRELKVFTPSEDREIPKFHFLDHNGRRIAEQKNKPNIRQEDKPFKKRGSPGRAPSHVESKGLLSGKIRPVSVDDMDDAIHFEYNGLVYMKADFKGYVVQVPVTSDHKYAGQFVLITGIGGVNVKVAPVDAKDKSILNLPLKGDVGFMPKRIFGYYFGG